MPKEQINHPQTYPWSPELPVIRDGMTAIEGAPEKQITEMRTDPTLCVRWQGGDAGHVQISFDLDVAMVTEQLQQPGTAEPDDRVVFYCSPLRRNEINHMIKVLRRARDAAFGRDE